MNRTLGDPEFYTTESYLRTIVTYVICLGTGGFIDDTYYSKIISYNGYGYDWADKTIIYFFHYTYGLLYGVFKGLFTWITEFQLTPFPNLNSFMDMIVIFLICVASVLGMEKLREYYPYLRRQLLSLTIAFPLVIYMILKFIAFLFMKN